MFCLLETSPPRGMASKLGCSRYGKDTTYDVELGGRSCEHCGRKRPHSYVFFTQLSFPLYFGACLAVESFVLLPFPYEVKIPGYMGLFL